jgi:hypothetical protein
VGAATSQSSIHVVENGSAAFRDRQYSVLILVENFR